LFVLVALYVYARFRDIAVPYWTAERQASADLFGFLEERLAGTEDIRSNGAEAYVMRRFFQLMRKLLRRSLKAALMINILLNTSFLLFTLGNAVAFAVGAWLYWEGVLTIGSVYIIFHYTNMLEQPVRQISRQMEDLQKAGAGIIRVRELLSVQTRIPDVRAGARLAPGPLVVEFRDVSFGYEGEVQAIDPSSARPGVQQAADEREGEPAKGVVLRDLSFQLAAGTVLGLLGRTGSGKTTLTRLLFRLYDPDQGVIRLSDARAPDAVMADIRHVPLADLRQRIGMVTQNIQLFHATVRDNLTFFDGSIPDEQILQALQDLGLWGWFQALPQGLDTELESGGGGLSAGEAQLLAFARIFLRDPGLVILDEASSRLDPATEHLIERAVDRLVQNRTAIIIAHRLGTVQRADEIMILENGHIGEYGARAALASDPASQFYRLLQTGLEEVLA
jgi:ATP-binding cassette subfamily B protein